MHILILYTCQVVQCNMGCSNSKVNSNPAVRMLEYEQIAAAENEGLKTIPGKLDTEEWRDGLVSARSMFNMFHAGYCSAYMQNPSYMLVVDFRSLEDWIVERVVTSLHHERLQNSEKGLHHYSIIILYDKDGASVGNIKSPLRKTYVKMRSQGLEPKVILGGFRALTSAPYSTLLEQPKSIPYAASVQPTVHNSMESLHSESPAPDNLPCKEPARRGIHWMPSMILDKKIYLGRADQASDPAVIHSLGITHVLSTSRVRATKFRGLVYILVNKTSFSHSTLKLTSNFILEALAGGGRVLVHGCDGFDQSAAVVIAALMKYYTATLEDCLWFVHSSRPGVSISTMAIRMLITIEEEMFGRQITDLQSLWCFDE